MPPKAREFRTGGRQQRASSRMDYEDSDSQRVRPEYFRDLPTVSTLAKLLVKEWCWGILSASQVQQLAKAAHDSQLEAVTRAGGRLEHCDKDLKELGELGQSGLRKNNVQRQLKTWLGTPKMPEPYTVNIRMQAKKVKEKGSAVRELPVDFLLPHQLFCHLFENHRSIFNSLFLAQPEGGESQLPHFWKQVAARRDPRLQHHPMLRRPQWSSKAVPISLHGDAVPCIRCGRAGSRSLDVYSWQGLLGQGPTLWQKQYIFAVWTSLLTGTTMQEAWAVLSWSLQALYEGKWPSTDHRGIEYTPTSLEGLLAGKHLAEGFFAVMWLLKGDLKYFHEGLGMRCVTSRDSPCDWCPCHRDDSGDPNYHQLNFNDDAKWRAECFTALQWKALYENRHLIFKSPWDFLSQLNCEPDILHVLHLGVEQVLLGTALWILAFRCLDKSPVQNVELVWQKIRAYYDAHDSDQQYSGLVLNSFTNPQNPKKDYPRLKGRGLEVKHMVKPVLSVFRELKRAGNEEDNLLESALSYIVDINTIIDQSWDQPFLSKPDASKIRDLVDRFVVTWAILHDDAKLRGDVLYHVLPKHHVLVHLAAKCGYLHPRLGGVFRTKTSSVGSKRSS